jgi:integrase
MQPDACKEARVLTPKEKAALILCAGRTLRDQLLFAMTMGMRLREHIRLSWSQIDFENRTLTLKPEHTKTKKGRTIYLSPQVEEMLLRRKRLVARRFSNSPYVFPSRGNHGRPVNQNKSAWFKAKREAGIVGRCRYHDLRHTFLTECARMVRDGRTSIALVCVYAGLSIRTFERTYLHLSHEDTAEISRIVAVKLL